MSSDYMAQFPEGIRKWTVRQMCNYCVNNELPEGMGQSMGLPVGEVVPDMEDG
jgi:hypothetical protein